LNQSAGDGTFVVSHGVTLTGLTAQQTYYYRVVSADFVGNTATSPIGDQPSFITLPELAPGGSDDGRRFQRRAFRRPRWLRRRATVR
jgi:hypothetical protein